MKHRRASVLWLKAFSVPILATAVSLLLFFLLRMSIGLPHSLLSMTNESPVLKGDPAINMKDPSWCYRFFGDGYSSTHCGAKKNNKELFELCYYNGENEPELVEVDDLDYCYWGEGIKDLSWKGRNLYFGYYPGVAIVRNVVALVVDIPAYAVPAGAFLLLVFPLMHIVIFVVNAWKNGL